MNEKRHRLITAIAIAPVAGCVVGSAVNPTQVSGLLILPIYGLLYGCRVGMPSMLIFGLPWHWALGRLGLRDDFGYALGGAIAGLITPFLVFTLGSLATGGAYGWSQAIGTSPP